MKNFLKFLSTICLGLILVACASKNDAQKLVVGVSPVPHKELVELVRDDLKEKGIELEIVEFNDYVQPNLALKDKSIDANFFQHVPYMESFAKENNIDMVSVAKIHVEPLKIYSEKIKEISQVSQNAEVLIPNDPTNRGRALILLETAGLIKLKDITKLDSSVDDIVENLKNIRITTLNSEQIGPRLSEVEIAVINTNNAIASGINIDKAIFIEGKESPYANIITVLRENENDARVKTLVEVLQTEKVKKFIEEKYKGEVVPAF